MRLRLRGGSEFRRQIESFALMLSGTAVRGELVIYPRQEAITVKMVAWLPRPSLLERAERGFKRPAQSAHATKTLSVSTCAEKLLSAAEGAWVYNGNQLRRWIAEHRRHLQRWPGDADTGQNAGSGGRHRRVVHQCFADSAGARTVLGENPTPLTTKTFALCRSSDCGNMLEKWKRFWNCAR